ncbi:hypothetical protein V6O07_04660 [Arthrospira platensis SPKY2]
MIVLNLMVLSDPPTIISGEFPEDKVDRFIQSLEFLGTIIRQESRNENTEEGYNRTDIFIDINPFEEYYKANIILLSMFINNFITGSTSNNNLLRL